MGTARNSTPRGPQPASLSAQQMQAALPKLERRLAALKAVDIASITERGDARLKALQQKIDDTLVEIFGIDSVEYQRYRIASLEGGPMFVRTDRPAPQEAREGCRKGIARAVSTLETIAQLFGEKLEDLGESKSRDDRAASSMQALALRPEVAEAVTDLFNARQYASAIDEACKLLEFLVQVRSRRNDVSGADLMHAVFNPEAPILRFNELATASDRDEQRGMMFLFAGAVIAFTNPGGAESPEEEARRASEIIGLVNSLAGTLGRARRAIFLAPPEQAST
jgi:uncharacterized protein (TIGR02391 family)